jgi:phosphatidylserine/phosphatidylglycerophosphate/cardiolipin synthase-like enzyme
MITRNLIKMVIIVTLAAGIFNPGIADIITLKDSSTYEGIIGAEDSKTILLSVPGQMPLKIHRSSIKSITRGSVKSKDSINQSNAVDNLKFLSCGEYFSELKKTLKEAEKSIQVMMYYVSYRGRPGHPVTELVDLLAAAQKRGVKVTVLLESSTKESITAANRRAAKFLKKNGVNVRFYPVYPIMHVKLVIIDGCTSFLGSHNWTASAIHSNVESSVMITSQRVARQYAKYFKKNFNRAKP